MFARRVMRELMPLLSASTSAPLTSSSSRLACAAITKGLSASSFQSIAGASRQPGVWNSVALLQRSLSAAAGLKPQSFASTAVPTADGSFNTSHLEKGLATGGVLEVSCAPSGTRSYHCRFEDSCMTSSLNDEGPCMKMLGDLACRSLLLAMIAQHLGSEWVPLVAWMRLYRRDIALQ